MSGRRIPTVSLPISTQMEMLKPPGRGIGTYMSWGSVVLAAIIIVAAIGVFAFLFFTNRTPFGPIEPSNPEYFYPNGKQSARSSTKPVPLTDDEKAKALEQNTLPKPDQPVAS